MTETPYTLDDLPDSFRDVVLRAAESRGLDPEVIARNLLYWRDEVVRDIAERE